MTHPHETPEAQAALRYAVETLQMQADMLKHVHDCEITQRLRSSIPVLSSLLTTEKACKCKLAELDNSKPPCSSYRPDYDGSCRTPYSSDGGRCAHDAACHAAPKEQ